MKTPEELKSLPIYPHLDAIADALLSSPTRFLVLMAETAAGKSTAVPIGFLDRMPGRIVMLEPRRLATIAIADRIASLFGESAGGIAGYRVHLDSKVSERTRIEIITEAILTRRIQNDPSLDGISVVILDEFHERSVHTDLALALLKDIMNLRDDLFVVVMSATIDTAKIAAFLNAPVLSVPGRRFPVSISYATDLASRGDLSVADKTARAILRSLESPGGSILAFLPGLYEISRAKELLEGSGAEVLVLHSSVPLAEQRQVLSAPDAGALDARARRRIILSSSIAETSLTVPGVSVVIDSGLSRTVRFNIATGMDRLVTETESEFQATQRAGRAGRLGPGYCIRLWTERDVRVSETPPEITRTDILPLALECALWGVQTASGLDWLDPPNEAAWVAARDLLASIGAIDRADAEGRITPKGRVLVGLGVHPRIGAVALAGETNLAVKYGLHSDNPREQERFRADLERRVAVAAAAKKGDAGKASGPLALLEGFPDRIAKHRLDGVYQFPSGRLASLPSAVRKNTARPPEWIVAPDVDSGEREGRIYAFESLPENQALAWLERHAKESSEISFFGGSSLKDGKPVKTIRISYGKITLSERRGDMTADDIRSAVCAAVRRTGLSDLPWSDTSQSFLIRARFALAAASDDRKHSADDNSLLESLEEWLVPFLPANGAISESALLDALRYRLDGSLVDREAPSRLTLQNGLSRPLVYEELSPGEGPIPVLETRIQDLYGCADIPRVAGVAVLVKLLSPAGRPMQITRDLAGFWKGSWADVRKDMRGRYPKHDWPENPALASPPRPRRPHPDVAK